MRSNYRKLGEYIELVNDVNHQNKYGESDVIGVSNNKEIIETRANNKNRDFSKFYIVSNGDFIYNSRTSRMGDKVGLGFNESNQIFITSFNNTVFRIKNEKLLPAYLLMWFKREEFDRYARYHSWGSSTELFAWDDMCKVELPVPSIEKQREIVHGYNVVNDRIKINEQAIQKVEETAQVIYKQWFVDFEFPINKLYAESIGKLDLEGLPYKSSGGEMVYNEELNCEIPFGWNVLRFDEIMCIGSGKAPIDKVSEKTEERPYPIYGAGGVMGFSSSHLFNEQLLIIGRVGTHGVVQRINFPSWPSDNTLVIKSEIYNYSYLILKNINYDEINRGGVQGLITQTDIKSIPVLMPTEFQISYFENISERIYQKFNCSKEVIESLSVLRDLLLKKMSKA